MPSASLACQFCGQLNKVNLDRHADRPKCAKCAKPFLVDRPVKVKEENFDATVLKSRSRCSWISTRTGADRAA